MNEEMIATLNHAMQVAEQQKEYSVYIALHQLLANYTIGRKGSFAKHCCAFGDKLTITANIQPQLIEEYVN